MAGMRGSDFHILQSGCLFNTAAGVDPASFTNISIYERHVLKSCSRNMMFYTFFIESRAPPIPLFYKEIIRLEGGLLVEGLI